MRTISGFLESNDDGDGDGDMTCMTPAVKNKPVCALSTCVLYQLLIHSHRTHLHIYIRGHTLMYVRVVYLSCDL